MHKPSVSFAVVAHTSIIPLLLTHPSSKSGAAPGALESLRSWEAAIRGGMYTNTARNVYVCMCLFVQWHVQICHGMCVCLRINV